MLKSAADYIERGVASWYGPGFHAQSTSNGERYDMYAMTGAHKTLPLPAYVQVTNLQNGRSVTVRVNDRGPFKDGRIIDLSYTAAAKLDILKAGTAFVEVRAVSASKQPDETRCAGDCTVRASRRVLSRSERAKARRRSAFPRYCVNAQVRADAVNGRTLYRVRVSARCRACRNSIARKRLD